MAEKPSELNRADEPDAVSTAAGAIQDSLVSTRVDFDSRESDATDSDDATSESGEGTAEADEIRTKIEETRSNLGSTIDAIQEKLSFQNISDQVKEQVTEHIEGALETAKDTVYDATIGKMGGLIEIMNKGFKEVSKSGAVKAAGQNPLALSLIGLGIGMLLMQSRKKDLSSYRYERYDSSDEDNYGRSYDRAEYAGGSQSRGGASRGGAASFLKTAQSKIGDTAGSAYETVSGTASSAAGSVSDAASSAASAVSGAASTVSDAAGTAVSTVGDYSKGAYEKVGSYGKDAYEKVGESYEYYIEENPLAVGAVALAVGAAIGFSLPSTRYEGELMGATKQELMHKAQESAGSLVDKVKQVAGEAQKTLTEEVKSAAGEVQKTIGDQAKAQGLTGDDKPAGGAPAPKSPSVAPNTNPANKPKV